jgi:hypothetical protein
MAPSSYPVVIDVAQVVPCVPPGRPRFTAALVYPQESDVRAVIAVCATMATAEAIAVACQCVYEAQLASRSRRRRTKKR